MSEKKSKADVVLTESRKKVIENLAIPKCLKQSYTVTKKADRIILSSKSGKVN